MAKTSTPDPAPAPFPPEVCDQIAALPFEIPEYKPLSGGECGALGIEALEGYFYGDRVRFDTQGRRWQFRREAGSDDKFRLSIQCSVGDVTLCGGEIPLDRVASKEGEEDTLKLVSYLIEKALEVGVQMRAVQQKAKDATKG